MKGVGMKMKKLVIFSLKTCYRSIHNHLILVGFLFLLAFLFRSIPFIFSMLVSTSPVLVCTLALLGALLNIGKPNIPEIELDDRERHQLVSLEDAFLDDGIFNVEEKLPTRTSEIVNDIRKVRLDGSFGQLVDKISRAEELDDMEERLADRRVDDNQYSLITTEGIDDDEHLDQEDDDEYSIGSVDSTEVNVDNMDSLPGSPWKCVDVEEGYEDYREAMGFGYDGAQSSSPDASMVDITPLLDELDPLLDEDNSQSANSSLNDSYASSELSLTSNDSSSALDDDLDGCQELPVGDDDEDGDDEEELNEDNEGQITWTKEDQKNLMDIRTSELQRNQRLEKLIAMRRAQRSMSMVTERNLINLDSSDRPFNVPPISTARTNPNELLQDSYDNTGFPPIPGSAPSILLPRKHPFDIPYDLSEEKPDFKEGSFHQEFMPLLPKDPFFRRHDSSNVPPSSFGMSRIEKQAASRFRRHFVSKRLGSKEPSYSTIRRQSSDLSDAAEEEASFIDIETPHTDDMAHEEHVNDSSPSATSDPQVDSELDSSAMMFLVILWLLQNPQQSLVKETLTDEEQNSSNKDDEGAFEPSVSFEGGVHEIDSVEKGAISSAVMYAGVTNEHKSSISIASEVDTSVDVGSDRGESDVKETMRNAVGGTGFGIKPADAMMWVNQMLVTRKKIQ